MSVASLTAFISANPSLAYGAVFLLALSEAVPVVGAVVPGSALIIGIAALAPQGLVSVWFVLAAAILGAIVGDGLSYWLGHRYGSALLSRWPLDRAPELVARSEAFIARHGGKSVFLARFTPGIRAFVPLLAGIFGMSVTRFTLANVLSALAWGPAHVVPGLAIGASVSAVGARAGRAAVLLVVLIAAIWLVLWAVRAALRFGIPLLVAWRDRLWSWAEPRSTGPARLVRALLDPARPETGALALLGVLVLGAAWLFFGVLEDVVSGDPLVQADRAVYNLLQGVRSPALDRLMIAITELGDTVVVTLVTVIVFAWLCLRRTWRAALYWAAAVGFASAINTGIKLIVVRSRPAEGLYTSWSAFSFPSGHSTVNAVLYGFLGFLIARELKPRWRVPVVACALAFAVTIALSRLYLGAHWFSDVVGSLAFATVWTIALGIAYVHHDPPTLNPRTLAAVAGAAIVLVGSYNVSRRHASDVERYAVRTEVPVLEATDWLAGGWRQRPAFRTDLTGEAEEPFTLQWAGSPAALEQALALGGWRRPAPWTLANALGFASPSGDPLALPVVPLAAGGRFPELTLVHQAEPTDAVSRLVLRLWSADVVIAGARSEPLWIGSLVEERLAHPLGLVTLTRRMADANRPRAAVAAALAPAGRLASWGFTAEGWDGQVILAQEEP